jgi:hypothetical protein
VMPRQTAALLSDSDGHYKFRVLCKYAGAVCGAA